MKVCSMSWTREGEDFVFKTCSNLRATLPYSLRLLSLFFETAMILNQAREPHSILHGNKTRTMTRQRFVQGRKIDLRGRIQRLDEHVGDAQLGHLVKARQANDGLMVRNASSGCGQRDGCIRASVVNGAEKADAYPTSSSREMIL